MLRRPLQYALLVIVISAVAFASMPRSFGHASIVDSSPAPFASVPSTPGEIVVNFSEPIEISYSRISVIAPDGSRVDRNDPHHVDGDTSTFAVSMQPALPEGVYTVTTRVLSAVDGHVTDGAFTFGIGVAPGGEGPSGAPSSILQPTESASRFPGMVGQIIVVGAAFGSLWLWKPLERVPWLAAALGAKRPAVDRSMVKLVIIGTGLVIGSNIAMIAVQAIDIGAGIPEAIATKFGNVWMTRMIESSILMIIAFFVYRKVVKTGASPSRAEMLAILVMGIAVLVTSSLIAHGAATGETVAILLDFFHNAAASIWIGGLVLMGFVAVPKILSLADERARSAAISILIPRFSTIVVTILGISIITGPLLLFMIESDLSLTLASMYGRILAIKLGLAGVMVALGAYSQFVIQKKAVLATTNGSSVQTAGYARFAKSLKVEAGVGIALLLMVSLMANSALPAGEFPQYGRQDEQAAFAAAPVPTTYEQTLYTSAGKVRLSIDPFIVGQNKFSLAFFDAEGNPADVSSATIKLAQIERGIGPISIDTVRQQDGTFAANAALSLPGKWSIQVEGTREQSASIVASVDATVRPAMSSLKFEVREYEIPSQSLPLFPVYDRARQSIWAGDSLPESGRMWQLDMATGNYTEHRLANVSLVTQTALDADGTLWYIDPVQTLLGHYDPETGADEKFPLPEKGILSSLAMDQDGNLWMPIVQPNKVYKFSPAQGEFTAIDIHTPDSRPVAITAGADGKLWLAESVGKIAMIDPATGGITEYEPSGQNKLDTPTVVFPDGNVLYISEHDSHTVTAFNPLFETFREYPSLNEGGLPFGMAKDAYGNIWFAEHEIDRMAVFDPRTGQGTEVKIPTAGSFIQYITADDQGKIWFAEQRGAAIGSVTITAGAAPPQEPGGETPDGEGPVQDVGFSLADAAGPGIVAGIVLSAFLYAKSSMDLKRNVRAAMSKG
ncbi:MAG TPA: copper resistance protein CopC [Nitrososphaera sp.]